MNRNTFLSVFSCLCLFFLGVCFVLVTNAQTADVRTLTQGQTLERELAGGGSHDYKIKVAANQYLKIIVEQKGIDVVVEVYLPDGKKLFEVDSPNGTNGPEPVELIASTEGDYVLKVRSLEDKAPSGRYEIKVSELRSATEKDKQKIDAQKAFDKATQLQSKGTAESLRSAIKKYEEALLLFRAVGDRSHEAATLHETGFVYDSLGDKQKALDYYNQALPLIRALGERSGEATILNNIGSVYFELGDKQKALDYYNQTLPFYRAVKDHRGEARTLNNISQVYDSLGEKQKALDYLVEALPLTRAVEDRNSEARTLNNMGRIYDDLGEKRKALDYYAQTLSLIRAVRNRRGEATILNNIGAVYENLGEKQKALDYYAQAMSLFRATGDSGGEATILNNIGGLYNDLDEKQKALDHYAQALPLFRAVGNRVGEGTTFHNIGAVYTSLGEKQKALDYYNQALSLFRAAKETRREAMTLNSIGLVNDDLGEKQKALDYYAQALPLHRVVGNRSGEAVTLSNIGGVYKDKGEKQKALDYYQQSLPLARAIEDRNGEARTLNNIGTVYDDLNEKQKATEYFNQALPLYRAVGNRSGEAGALYNLASLAHKSGNLAESLTNIEAAITIVESLRNKIVSRELRTSYFATVQKYYEFYIELLMQLHKQKPTENYVGKAFQASERARARGLLELLSEANVNIKQGVDEKLLETERNLRQRISARTDARIRLLNSKHTQEQEALINKEIKELTDEYEKVEVQIRTTSPRYSALAQPQPIKLSEIQKLLDADTMLLEYALGDVNSYLFAITQNSISVYELPKRIEIEDAAKQVYKLLTVRECRAKDETTKQWDARIKQADADYTKASADLSQMILGAVADKLGSMRLLIAADGALNYIPFAALPIQSSKLEEKKSAIRNPQSAIKESAIPLVAKHEIVNLPSASTLALLRQDIQGRKQAEKTIAVFANPIFSKTDLRIIQAANPNSTEKVVSANTTKRSISALVEACDADSANANLVIPILGYSEREAKTIKGLVPDNMQKISLGEDANYANATNADLSNYRFVHFATHGFLNSNQPELSGILLSLYDKQGREQPNSFLSLSEIYNLKLSADMVVLSACQTALGKDVRGEGLVGLTRGFMYAGAPRVVASLWRVEDAATSQLMKEFYKNILSEHQPPAKALQKAQLAMLKNGYAPFYWAAFTIQGEWK
jgi:CHAT domain-containing protein/Flp pilus assembly protein TadD